MGYNSGKLWFGQTICNIIYFLLHLAANYFLALLVTRKSIGCSMGAVGLESGQCILVGSQSSFLWSHFEKLPFKYVELMIPSSERAPWSKGKVLSFPSLITWRLKYLQVSCYWSEPYPSAVVCIFHSSFHTWPYSQPLTLSVSRPISPSG